jgi:tight adherence protein B
MTRAGAAGLAGLAAVLATAAAALLTWESIARVGSRLRAVHRSAGRVVEDVLAPLRRAGDEGRDATRFERRRLRFAFGLGALPLALALADPLPAAGLAAAAGGLAPRALVWRRERYTRRLAEGAATAAGRIADALTSGHTTRAAISIAAGQLDGPIGRELSRVASALQLGATTDAALAAFRARAGSRRIDLLVAAVRLQRRSGGNLAALLRDIAAALEDRTRLEAEARAETAQARFTSTVVLAMPFCLLGLGEIAAPGTIGRVLGSAIGVWLVGSAAAMQVGGALLVRRLARIEA